jgi:hypothetical protein
MFRKSLMVVAAAMTMAGSAMAENYNFNLHNNANGWVIDGFYTYQDGKWSKNWLSEDIEPGQYGEMLWNSEEGDCVVPFRVSWTDWGHQDFTMDWCKNHPTNVYMKDKGFDWD